MNTNKSWLYLGLGLTMLLVLAFVVLWALPAGAAPVAQTTGTLTLDESFISPDDANLPATSDRAVRATVTDVDLDVRRFVGPGPAGETASLGQVLIAVHADLNPGTPFLVNLSLGAGAQTVDVAYILTGDAPLPLVDRNGDGQVNVSDLVVIDPGDDANEIGDTQVGVLELFDAATGIVQFRAQGIGITAGDVFAIRYATSGREGTLVKVQGDAGTMFLNLLETSTAGEYTGDVVVADEATVDIGNVVHEQHAIPGNFRTDLSFTDQHRVSSNLTAGDQFTIALDFTPADVDAVAGDGFVDRGDLALLEPAAGVLAIAREADIAVANRRLTLTASGDANIGDAFTVRYGHAIAAESLTIPAFPGFVNLSGGTTADIETGDIFAIALSSIPLDANDNGILDVGDITVTPSNIGVATVTGGSATTTFVVRTGGGAITVGSSFTVNYNGQFDQLDAVPQTGLVAGERFVITVNNAPIRDRNDDGVVTGDDVTVSLGTLIARNATGDTGEITLEATSAIALHTAFAVTYRGAQQG